MEFFWSLFPRIRTECEELLGIYSYSVQMRENPNEKYFKYGHFSRSEIYSKDISRGLPLYYDL